MIPLLKINNKNKQTLPLNPKILNVIFSLWRIISFKRKLTLLSLLILSLCSGFAELISFGAVIPFLSVLTDPSNANKNKEFLNIISFIGLDKNLSLPILVTLLFGLAVFISTIIRLSNLWLNAKTSSEIGNDLSVKAYRIIVNKPYSFHIEKNSSEIISTISKQIPNTVSAINDFLQLITGLFVSLFIFIGFIFIDYRIAFFSISLFGFIYILISLTARRKLNRNSQIILDANQSQILLVQEALGSIKDIILGQIQNYFLKSYSLEDKIMREKEAETAFILTFPRFAIEGVGLILISIFSLIYTLKNNNSESIIPFLGALALGSQRLLPAMQLIYSSWSGLKAKSSSLFDVLKVINSRDFSKNSSHIFKLENNFEKLELKNVSFFYKSNKSSVFSNINLRINKGERLGIVGQTGSGKSTLIDLIMGLLEPSRGEIYVNKYDINAIENVEKLYQWRSNIAYVPQNIFLLDKTIAENIAFGCFKKDLDIDWVKKVAKLAQINNFIENLPNKYNTKVGERGINLSGGQIQRISIARALYKNPSILILDEATSALDELTEKMLMRSIEKLDKKLTIIMIAHRKSTLSACDRVISIQKGNLEYIIE